MLGLVYGGLIAVFFAVAIAYIFGRDRLKKGAKEKELGNNNCRCLLISSLLAMFAGIIGLTFGALSMLRMIGISDALQTIGTLLIAVTIPLMAVVAHCLDKIDSVDRELRSERCLKNGPANMKSQSIYEVA